MSCPGAETFAAWAAGQVGGGERDRLEDHCAGCRLCRGLMLVLSGVATAATPAIAKPTTIGRYEIRATLRDGVLRGWDPELARDVTIAVASVPDPAEREAIIAGADKVAQLTHRNLARVYDSGSIGDTVYIAMQAVEGESWNDWLLQRPRRAWRRRMVREVGNALNAMHRRGVIHRDIRPSNITIKPDGSAVLHLGLGQSPAVANELTTGARPSARSDQFAWWMLATTALGTGFPHRRAFKKGLAKNPRLRFPTMDAAVGALATPWWYYAGAAAIGLVILGAVVGAVTDAAKPAQHDPSNDVACRITAPGDWQALRPVIAVRLGMATRHADHVLKAIDDRVLHTAAMQRETCAAGNSKQLERACVDATWSRALPLVLQLASAEPQDAREVIDGLVVTPPPEACTATPMPRHAPDVDPSAQALDQRIYRELAAAGDPTTKLAHLRSHVPEVDRLASPSVSWRLHDSIAKILYITGKHDDAVGEAKLALASAEASGDDLDRASTLIALLRYQGRTDPSLEATAEAAVQAVRTPALTARLHAEEGYLLEQAGQWERAVVRLEQAKSEYALAAIDLHEDQASISEYLANAYSGANAHTAAKDEFQRALAAAADRYGDAAPVRTRIRSEAASNLFAMNELDLARREYQAVVTELSARGAAPVYLAFAYADVCEVDIASAGPSSTCDRALALATTAYGAGAPELIWYLDLAGKMQLVTHEDRAALATFERALAIAETGVAAPTNLPVTQAMLAIALHRLDPRSPRAARLAKTARTSLASVAEARSVVADLDSEFK